MHKQRFEKLYRLAHGGDMVAKADLWLEFGFAYDHDPLPSFMNPPALPIDSPSASSLPSVVKNKNSPAPPSCASSLHGEPLPERLTQPAPKQEIPCK